MKPGPLEIVLITVIIIAAAVIARMVRTGRRRDGEKEAAAPDRTGKNPDRLYGLFNRTGIGLTIVGFLALIAAFGMFRWALQSYLWAFLVIAIGFFLILLSRVRRR
ncbi:MAG: hypothetical protein ABID71_08320 [Chloroflexota bacterium]